jgi:hypothetical protein
VAVIIKLGQIKKGAPLDKNEYGFRIFISRGVGRLRGVMLLKKDNIMMIGGMAKSQEIQISS